MCLFAYTLKNARFAVKNWTKTDEGEILILTMRGAVTSANDDDDDENAAAFDWYGGDNDDDDDDNVGDEAGGCGLDMNNYTKKRNFSSMVFEKEAEEAFADSNQPIVAQKPHRAEERVAPVLNSAVCDPTVNRPEYEVTNSVSYYNLGSLFVLLYAHVTEGTAVPVVFDRANQTM